MDIFAQAVGLLGMAVNVSSFQCKRQKTALTLQLIGPMLFAVNMYLVGAGMGFLLNVIGVIRALVYLQADRLGAKLKYVSWGFTLSYFVAYGLTFTLFGTEPTWQNLLIELLPLIGMIAMTIGFSKGTPKYIRLYGYINSPSWLIYNCFRFTLGGILCEIICLISITTAALRLDRKTERNDE